MSRTSATGAGSPPPSRGRIDIPALAQELLTQAATLVPAWLPGGVQEGHEWKCGDLTGGRGGSCSVNLVTGQWADFADDEKKGGDLVSLYAAIHDLSQLEAARELVDNYRLQHVVVAAPAPAKPAAPAKRAQPEKGEFTPIVPVPSHAGPRPAKHPFRGVPQHVWEYRLDGQLLGAVYRFVTSDGGKEVLPCVFGQSLKDSSQKWVWKTWDEPRPLYLPAGRKPRPGAWRVIVEGEKCADAAHALIGGQEGTPFDVLSWPGGGKAVPRADWSWAGGAGDRAVIWPDADCHRRSPTAEEKAAGIDKGDARLDYLPLAKQPGYQAALKIAQLLHANGVEVWMIPLDPLPADPKDAPARPDGWDCADAIAEGWGLERWLAYLRTARRWEPTSSLGDDAPRSAGASGGSSDDGAADEDGRKGWRVGLLKSPETGAIKAVRENVVLALMSLPQTAGKIAYNEFTNDIIKLADMPWGSPAGKWSEVDELHMGEWLVRKHWLPSMPRTTLEEGMRMVAVRNQYHPVRQYLRGLHWDGTDRLNDWLIRAVVAQPDKLGPRHRKYLQRVGAWFLMAMVARAMRPGCKFDYMPIFEGAQGMRKSSILKVLAGDWFADTGFVLGDKDTLQMLQGRWLYEISELDAMARAEVTKIKAFVASMSDWYRASFDKRPREYPRQLVFAGTTNEHQYLVDGTGNRRFWPIEVTRVIDTEWVQEVRDQLFAEAWHRVQQGERYYPNTREELELFMPQQKQRMVESPIEMRVLDHLVNHPEGQLLDQVSTVRLLGSIGIDLSKLGPGRFHEKQAGTALRKFGWERKYVPIATGSKARHYVYIKPPGWPDCIDLDDGDDEPPPAARAPAKQGGRASDTTPPDYDDGGPILAGGPADDRDDDVPF
jgi:putative DNA primase/helicase